MDTTRVLQTVIRTDTVTDEIRRTLVVENPSERFPVVAVAHALQRHHRSDTRQELFVLGRRPMGHRRCQTVGRMGFDRHFGIRTQTAGERTIFGFLNTIVSTVMLRYSCDTESIILIREKTDRLEMHCIHCRRSPKRNPVTLNALHVSFSCGIVSDIEHAFRPFDGEPC